MRFLRQSLIGVLLMAITLGLLAYAGHLVSTAVQDRLDYQSVAPSERERVFAVNVVRAVESSEIPILEAFGEVRSRRTLELRAAVGGRIISLAPEFTEGGVIKSGQFLFQVNPADQLAEVDRAQNSLLEAQSEVRDADRSLSLAEEDLLAAEAQVEVREKVFKRQEDLQTRGVGSAAAVENAQLALTQARQPVLSKKIAVAEAKVRIDRAATRLNRAKLELTEAERKLRDTKVFAAFDGTLNNVNVVEGRLVLPNEKLAELIDPLKLEVAFRVSTRQYVRLLDVDGSLIPSEVTVTLDGAGAELTATGTVNRDSVGVGAVQTGRLLYATLDTSVGFKPGDFVTVRVREPQVDDVVRLPATVYGSDGTILILDEANRLESIPVYLVRRQGDWVLLRAPGLPGRDVVQARTPLLGAGILVRPLQAGASNVAEPEMVLLEAERRARLVAFVEGNQYIPAEAKERILNQLAQDEVPAQMVERLESRMGG